MSAKNAIEEFLHAAFNLPVVVDLGQTKIERVISYRVAQNKTVSRSQSTQTLQLSLDISLRAENGYDSIGWLNAKLSEAQDTPEARLHFISPVESIEYVSTTETIFTCSITLICMVQMDVKKELIKTIEWSDQ